jgi:hypothetical protein
MMWYDDRGGRRALRCRRQHLHRSNREGESEGGDRRAMVSFSISPKRKMRQSIAAAPAADSRVQGVSTRKPFHYQETDLVKEEAFSRRAPRYLWIRKRPEDVHDHAVVVW